VISLSCHDVIIIVLFRLNLVVKFCEIVGGKTGRRGAQFTPTLGAYGVRGYNTIEIGLNIRMQILFSASFATVCPRMSHVGLQTNKINFLLAPFAALFCNGTPTLTW